MSLCLCQASNEEQKAVSSKKKKIANVLQSNPSDQHKVPPSAKASPVVVSKTQNLLGLHLCLARVTGHYVKLNAGLKMEVDSKKDKHAKRMKDFSDYIRNNRHMVSKLDEINQGPKSYRAELQEGHIKKIYDHILHYCLHNGKLIYPSPIPPFPVGRTNLVSFPLQEHLMIKKVRRRQGVSTVMLPAAVSVIVCVTNQLLLPFDHCVCHSFTQRKGASPPCMYVHKIDSIALFPVCVILFICSLMWFPQLFNSSICFFIR